MFLKRAFELDILEKDFNRLTSSFLFIFGQKRVGKKALVQEHIKNKNSLFFSCIEILPHLLFENFTKQVAQKYKIANEKITTLESFLVLLSTINFKEKTVIVFDNSQILAKIQKTPLESFYKLWCSNLINKNIQIVFLSLLYSPCKNDTLIYEQASETIFLKPLKSEVIKEILPTLTKYEQLKLFAIFGTNLYYLKQYKKDKSFEDNIKDIFINNNQVAQDMAFYLKDELNEVATYNSILNAIAQKEQKIGDIAQALRVKSSYLTRYLQKLTNMMIIKKTLPLGEEFKNSKFGRYSIEDNFLKFWFKSLCFNTHLLNKSSTTLFLRHIHKELEDGLLEDAFKKYMKETIEENFEAFFEYKALKIGQWWNNKAKHIDLVAYSNNNITFIDIKYNSSQNVQKLQEELKRKSQSFETVLNKNYALFSTK